ncbi:TauD/TfdA family dioxygenase [Geodermatophilus sp. URMC 62]|uniref:TauD/TfdA family dioxygenase n=1 Tax=Geodermatophilus sp. URMC 62 TaxID=3423414 RepID=UPI00406C587C
MSIDHSHSSPYKVTTLIRQIHLPRVERMNLRTTMQRFGPISDQDVTDGLIEAHRSAFLGSISGPTREYIYEALRSQTVTVLRGIGLLDDELPMTPSEDAGFPPLVTNNLHLAVCAVVAEPASYDVEQSGRLIHHLVAQRGQEHTLTGRGGAPLGQHNDLAALNDTPEALIITGLRAGDPPVPTLVAGLEAALRLLSPRERQALEQPDWDIAMPYAYEEAARAAGQEVTRNVPLVQRLPDGRRRIRAAFYGDRTRPLSRQAEAVTRKLRTALDNVAEPVALYPGDVVVIPNRSATHGRGQVPSRHTGTDRWLLRTSVFPEHTFRRLRPLMNTSRVIDTRRYFEGQKP